MFHHNHPSDTALSGPDVQLLAFPGIDTIAAHGHEGNLSAASLTPEARAYVSANQRAAIQYSALASGGIVS